MYMEVLQSYIQVLQCPYCVLSFSCSFLSQFFLCSCTEILCCSRSLNSLLTAVLTQDGR